MIFNEEQIREAVEEVVGDNDFTDDIIKSLNDKFSKLENISELVKVYYDTEGKLIDLLDNLQNSGEECNCDNCTKIDFIHEGEWKEITTRCLNCGGYIENV